MEAGDKMARRLSFRERLAGGETLIGPILTFPAPDVADLLSRVGFDYLWLDLEHSAMAVSDAQSLVQGIGGRCPSLIRVPQNDEAWIKKALDTGCDGLVLPQMRSAAEVAAALAWCLYPPQGRRGAGPARAQAWGLDFASYVARANRDLTIVVQIEHIDAVNDIEAILRVPGISALLIGPFDLSGSFGVLGQIGHPDVQAAIDRVLAACRSASMPAGIFCGSAEAARQAIARGFSLIALSTDAAMLAGAAKSTLEAARAAP